MAIYRLLQHSGFYPDDIERMTTAYERVLVLLGLKDRSDPVTEIVAKRIIEVAQTGEKDPDLVCALVLKSIGIPARETEQNV